jgi:hypothetical protein
MESHLSIAATMEHTYQMKFKSFVTLQLQITAARAHLQTPSRAVHHSAKRTPAGDSKLVTLKLTLKHLP